LILQADEHVRRALGVVLGAYPGVGGLSPAVDRRVLKSAFRRRAHQLHPDKARAVGLSEQALAHRFRELKHAYDYLLALLDAPALIAERRFRRPGAIPRKRLRFAQYLYFTGIIDWHTLLAAMRWQHSARPRLGEIARQMSFLSSEDVGEILRLRGGAERFGDAALRLGRLDHVRLFAVLGRQRRFDRPIGRFFVDHGILTPVELAQQLDRHWAHNLACAAAEIQERFHAGARAGGGQAPVGS
jgi:hypothetical protein